MKKGFNLDFCFKGSRQYVHGTDIYTKLLEYYSGDIKDIDIAFHGISTNNMTFTDQKPEVEEIKVTFKCLHEKNKIKLYGIENSSNINCRYEYLENKIVDDSTVNISENTILLNIPTEYSFIEHIVAMNKVLMEQLYNDINGKWYFTRLQLKENISMSIVSSLQLILKSNFQFKLTKSVIVVNGIDVGFIYFSLIREESKC